MKELKKIKLIDSPKEEIKLDDNDMSFLLGGDNCISFTECGGTGKNICYERDGSLCSGSNTMRCSTHAY